MNIIPVILSGGSGTRLWPISRRDKPKQFLEILPPHNLLQQTLLRCSDKSVFDDKPIIVSAADHRSLISKSLAEIEVSADIILEPCPRNSCAAITAACIHAQKRTRDAVVLILACDHYIPDQEAFTEYVAKALEDARDGYLVTFGIKPTHPATGYGYISPGNILRNAFSVKEFVEKPDAITAQHYLENGYLWNSGNFLFRAKSFSSEMENFEPDILSNVVASIENSSRKQNVFELDKSSFSKAASMSVDNAIMEHSNKTAVLPVDYKWLDIGSWTALAEILPKDHQGNAIKGNVKLLKSKNNIVYSESKLTTVVGVQDTVIVATRDAVLVTPISEVKNIRELVNSLDEKSNSALRNIQPLDAGPLFQVKRFTVKPGGVLPTQNYQDCSQHWIVAEGKAEVTINGKVQILKANQSVYIPQESLHQLANRQSDNLVIIAVQIGNCTEEVEVKP